MEQEFEKYLFNLGFESISQSECLELLTKNEPNTDKIEAERVSKSRDWLVYRGDLVLESFNHESLYKYNNHGYMITGNLKLTDDEEFYVDDGYSLIVLGDTYIKHLFLEGETYLLGNTYCEGYLAGSLNVHPRYVKNIIGKYIYNDSDALCICNSQVELNISDLGLDVQYLIIKNEYIEDAYTYIEDCMVQDLYIDRSLLLENLRQGKDVLIKDAVELAEGCQKLLKKKKYSDQIIDIEILKEVFENHTLSVSDKLGSIKLGECDGDEEYEDDFEDDKN